VSSEEVEGKICELCALIFREFSSVPFDRHHWREQTFPVSNIPAQLVPRGLEYSFLVLLSSQQQRIYQRL